MTSQLRYFVCGPRLHHIGMLYDVTVTSLLGWVSTASVVFLIFTTQLYQYFSVLFLFALFSDGPEVFLPKYSQTAILHAAHFQRLANTTITIHGKHPLT